jgi:hypothetical protein
MGNALRGGISRRGFVGSAALAGLVAGGAAAQSATAGAGEKKSFDIVLRPTRVYKTPDHSHENTESWIFSAMVQSSSPDPLVPAAMTVELLKGGTVLRETHYPKEGFAPLTYRTVFPPLLADGRASPSPIFWPFVVRLRHTEPVALGVDAMRLSVVAADPAGQSSSSMITVPLETYQQKTPLIFPFRGKGIILQGGATNGGHRNRSGAFAIDAMGLTDAWSVEIPGDGKKNTDYPGWGRPLIAPADGTIARARNDRPDQPVGDQSDQNYYADEFKKLGGGDPGNHLVIDHGNGEFSMIAHFMAGSMLVKMGDRVAQGQVLGKLGHSGDTSAPHVHYQLQAGQDWENADGLPMKFTNVDEPFLDRGTYFETK